MPSTGERYNPALDPFSPQNEAVSSSTLLDELKAQIEVWETMARTLDKMKAKHVCEPEEMRLAIKAGFFRSVARDLKLLIRDFDTSNDKITSEETQ